MTTNIVTSLSSPSSPPQSSIELNPEQAYALQVLLDFVADPDPEDLFFVFYGPAGVGKTFLMRELLARCSKSRVRFAFTAPTNKAAKVLRGVTGSACTIYSLLGLRIEKNGEFKELVGGARNPNSEDAIDLSGLDVVVIDEGSMINAKLMQLLRDTADRHQIKIIVMGDEYQLPPVNEPTSPIWKLPLSVGLTTVMRHDNQILKLVTAIRGVVNSLTPSIAIRSDNSDKEGVWKLTKHSFKDAVFNEAAAGTFADGSKGKVIAWRNERVAEYNYLIRRAIFGAEATTDNFLLGDRIIATAPCNAGDQRLLSTDDEAIIEGIIATTHPTTPKYFALELKCRTEDNRVIRLTVLHPRSAEAYTNDCADLAHQAKETRGLWKRFWDLKELFHDVKYAYAITAHRAQGSTYETAFVDYQDILCNRNRKEAFQCLYVACSRPTTRLILA